MNDQELSKLMREWRAPEAGGGFEQDVWRKIRLAETRPSRRGAWLGWLQPAPALSAIAALLVAAFIAYRGSASQTDSTLFPAGSISASYVQMISGDAR